MPINVVFYFPKYYYSVSEVPATSEVSLSAKAIRIADGIRHTRVGLSMKIMPSCPTSAIVFRFAIDADGITSFCQRGGDREPMSTLTRAAVPGLLVQPACFVGRAVPGLREHVVATLTTESGHHPLAINGADGDDRHPATKDAAADERSPHDLLD